MPPTVSCSNATSSRGKMLSIIASNATRAVMPHGLPFDELADARILAVMVASSATSGCVMTNSLDELSVKELSMVVFSNTRATCPVHVQDCPLPLKWHKGTQRLHT